MNLKQRSLAAPAPCDDLSPELTPLVDRSRPVPSAWDPR
jgi:hypothetical protein